MQVRKTDWEPVRWLPFLERRMTVAYLSCAPIVPYCEWIDWRFCNPFSPRPAQ